MVKCLTIFATLTIFSGCCSVPAHVEFECPERPVLEAYSIALWDVTPKEAQEKISDDIADIQSYIKSCEARAKVHND